MHVQQIRQVRVPVLDAHGHTRIEVKTEPEADAETLQHQGRVYQTLGNGVFDIPDAVAAQIVGPLFRDLTGFEGNPRRQAGVLSSAHAQARPPGQSDDAPLYAPEQPPEGLDPDEVAAAGLQEVELPEEPLGLPNAAGSLVAGEPNDEPQNPHADGELTRQLQGAQHTPDAPAKRVAKKATKATKAKKATKKKAAPAKG